MSVGEPYFEKLFADSDDPWAFRTRWYERRKRDLILASLPRQFYARAFEPACANGELSVVLAHRTAELLCQDLNPRAVALAQQRLAGCPQASVASGALPEDWPQGTFDLIVLGEIGYYLDPAQWQRVIEYARACLRPEGGLLACHWLHPIEGCSQNGRQVHQIIEQHVGLPRMLRHEEKDFLLEYWGASPVDLDESSSLG